MGAYIKRKNHPANKSETPNINFEQQKVKCLSENSKSKPTNEGLLLAKQATEEDRKKNYVKAVELYENSVQMLNLALKKEKFSESSKSKISNNCKQYLERAEKLKGYVNTSNLKIHQKIQ